MSQPALSSPRLSSEELRVAAEELREASAEVVLTWVERRFGARAAGTGGILLRHHQPEDARGAQRAHGERRAYRAVHAAGIPEGQRPVRRQMLPQTSKFSHGSNCMYDSSGIAVTAKVVVLFSALPGGNC